MLLGKSQSICVEYGTEVNAAKIQLLSGRGNQHTEYLEDRRTGNKRLSTSTPDAGGIEREEAKTRGRDTVTSLIQDYFLDTYSDDYIAKRVDTHNVPNTQSVSFET